VPALKRLVDPATLGDPMRPLIWVSKSTEKLAAALTEMGHPIGADTVRKELAKLGFSRQSNRKAEEGSKHPDRNAQFDYINARVLAAQARHQPVVSVDTKKKELIGNFKNGGTDYRPKGDRLDASCICEVSVVLASSTFETGVKRGGRSTCGPGFGRISAGRPVSLR